MSFLSAETLEQINATMSPKEVIQRLGPAGLPPNVSQISENVGKGANNALNHINGAAEDGDGGLPVANNSGDTQSNVALAGQLFGTP